MMRVGGMGGRIVPPEGNHGTHGQCGYISWHRDKPPADMWPLPNYRIIKCFLNVYDVPENGGETAVSPCRTYGWLIYVAVIATPRLRCYLRPRARGRGSI